MAITYSTIFALFQDELSILNSCNQHLNSEDVGKKLLPFLLASLFWLSSELYGKFILMSFLSSKVSNVSVWWRHIWWNCFMLFARNFYKSINYVLGCFM